MSDIASAFIAQSRYHLSQDYLPKIERCLALLTDKQIWWRANSSSNSIGNLLLHLSGNIRQWIVVGLGGTTDTRDRDAEFAQRDVISGDKLGDLLKRTVREADATLAAFDRNKLLDKSRIQGLEVPALEAILHVVEHFSMHTGQIILLTKMFTESDLAFYDFSDVTPRLTWNSEA